MVINKDDNANSRYILILLCNNIIIGPEIYVVYLYQIINNKLVNIALPSPSVTFMLRERNFSGLLPHTQRHGVSDARTSTSSHYVIIRQVWVFSAVKGPDTAPYEQNQEIHCTSHIWGQS